MHDLVVCGTVNITEKHTLSQSYINEEFVSIPFVCGRL